VAFYEPALAGLGRWLEVTTPVAKADLVVALGGDRTRQDEAVRLLRGGFAQKILFVGSDVRPSDYHCLDVAPERAIPPQAPAYTTADEAVVVRQVAETQHLASILVVTSPHHLRRAQLAFGRVFADSRVILLFAPAPNSILSAETWWKTHIGRKLVVTEYLGLIYYWLTV
jgi:uncharacterized SAM-binding protein YcdF (DUF218 family)